MPKLPDDVEKLIDETIKLVDLIYWKPEKRSAYQQRIALSLPMDVDAQDIQDIEEDGEDTLGKSRKRTQMVRCPGPNATLEQRKEYMQYLLSGRGGSVSNVIIFHNPMVLRIDFELDSDDEELLEELGFT